MSHRPPYLKPGDRVAIISTARKVDKDFVDDALTLLSSWELEVILGENLFAVEHQFAGTDLVRRNSLQHALDDPSIRAIFCARGGYGTIRILDELDFSTFQKSPKWIVGYSDVTVLHCHLQKVLNTESLHATMPVNFDTNSAICLENLKQVLFGNPLRFDPAIHRLNRLGLGEGILIGGNLSILYSLNGSQTFPDTTGKILFLEDLDEYLYHVDRMMMNLKRSGALSKLAGLIVGGMNDMRDNEIPFGKTAYEIIAETVSDYTYPVVFNFPAGHISDNQPLILGRTAHLTVSSTQVSLWFGE